MVDINDVLKPEGELGYELFIGRTEADVDEDLTAYLENGRTKAIAAEITDDATLDEIAKAYTYYRAYKDIYITISRQPATVTWNDKGSKTYSSQQPKRFLDLSNDWLAVVKSLAPKFMLETRPAVQPTSRARARFSF